jgi:hypothetical protein
VTVICGPIVNVDSPVDGRGGGRASRVELFTWIRRDAKCLSKEAIPTLTPVAPRSLAYWVERFAR